MQSEVEEAIVARGTTHILLPGIYWHLTAKENYLLHNVFLGEGITLSVSSVRKIPGLEKATSPYAFYRADTDEKEEVWEKVRFDDFKALPSRSGSFYVFDSKATAISMNDHWFAGARELVEVRIIRGAQIHVADTELLNCENKPGEWESYAKRYWSGEMTENARPEMLVDGSLYFPGWKAAPFGLMK